ncbi:MAG: TonB-dependent receptor [Candidatus Marinimicrobia bacterium]|nr:TonB-dependent receptor [Candidatus Neomarinimicrobiota bacterium]
MKNKVLTLVYIIILLIGMICVTLAGTRGKIAGNVIDKSTGLPLAGVNMYIPSEQIGSVTDSDGYFVILNVPPGIHDVVASMIGYKILTVRNVSVATDQTTNLDFEMESSILQGEEVVVVARKPLVQADLTSSKSIITEEDLKSMPTESFQGLLTTKAGVTEGASGAIHIRGGRSSEVLYMLDGIAVSNPFNSSLGINVSTNMIKELTMVSGTFNAEYGKAMSGIVNIVTRDGNNRFEGDVNFQFGDMLSSRTKIFDDVNQYDPLNFKRLDLSFSGPFIFLPRGSFIVAGTLKESDGWLYGYREHTPLDFYNFQGGDWFISSTGDGKRVGLNNYVNGNVMAKITTKPWAPIKISYHFNGYTGESQQYNHAWKYNPDGRYTYTSNNQMHSLHFTHSLSERSYYTVRASYKRSEAEDYVHKLEVPYKWNEDINGNGEIDVLWYDVNGTPFTEDLNGDGKLSNISVDWDLLRDHGAFIPNPTHELKYNDSTFFQAPLYIPTESRSDVPSYHFIYGSQRTGYFLSDNETYTLKADFTSQMNKYNQIRSGIEINSYMLHSNDIYIEMSDRTNWQPFIQSIATAGHDEYTRRPLDFAAYIQDKIEFKDIIVQTGLRYDYFDAKDNTFTNKTNPAGSDTLAVKPKSQISPRLGVSFPITDQGYIHFSYGHFFQMPPFSYLYQNPDKKKSSGVTQFGNPDLDAQKTVMYEFGLQQQLTPMMAMDVTIFYRNILNWLSSEYNFIDNTFRYTRYITQDYGNVRGITFSLTQRSFSGLAMNMDYTFQIAGGNASSPDAAYYDNLKIPPVESEKKLVPLDWDQRHTLNVTLSYSLKGNYGASVINRFSTGKPYTPTIQGQRNAEENSDRRIFQITTDLQAYKYFNLGNQRLSLSVKIYNLFDRLNEVYVNTDTGRSGSSLVPTYAGQSITMHADTPGIHSLEERLYPPTNYSNPRQILIGLSWHFQGK